MGRRTLLTILKVAISLLLLAWLLHRIGIDALRGQLSAARPDWLLLGTAAFAVSNLIGSLQWYQLLRAQDSRLSFFQVLGYYHVGLFFNNFLIGYIGGDAFRVYDVRKESGDFSGAFAAVFLDRFIGFFTMTSLALFFALLMLRDSSSKAVLYTVIIVLLGWILALLVLFRERIARKISWLIKLFIPRILHEKVREIYYDINRFRHQPKRLAAVFTTSVAVQSLRVLTHYFTARAFGVKIDPAFFFIFIPIIALISSLPISLGGIGVREQSGVTLFGQLGVPTESVFAFEFLAYVICILTALPGGIVFALRRSGSEKGGPT